MSDVPTNPYQKPRSEVKNNEQQELARTSGTALASGVIALVALILPAIGVRVGFVWWSLVLVLCSGLGIHGLYEIRKSETFLKGIGWAIWGLLYSAFILVIALLSFAGAI